MKSRCAPALSLPASTDHALFIQTIAATRKQAVFFGGWGGSSQQLANSLTHQSLQVVSKETSPKTSNSSLTLKDISSFEKSHFSC